MDTDSSSDAKNLVPASSREAVLASFDDGVASIASLGKQITRWDAATPCAAWDLRDLVGHLLAIIRYYHRLLDAATSGRPESALPRGEALAAMNGSDLATLSEHEGPERLGLFVEFAGAYRGRLETVDWDLELGRWLGLGALNIGEHSGVAIGEWHVHAWDLAQALGADHRPRDPLTVARGQETVLRVTDPGDDPWFAVLAGYGRTLDWRR